MSVFLPPTPAPHQPPAGCASNLALLLPGWRPTAPPPLKNTMVVRVRNNAVDSAALLPSHTTPPSAAARRQLPCPCSSSRPRPPAAARCNAVPLLPPAVATLGPCKEAAGCLCRRNASHRTPTHPACCCTPKHRELLHRLPRHRCRCPGCLLSTPPSPPPAPLPPPSPLNKCASPALKVTAHTCTTVAFVAALCVSMQAAASRITWSQRQRAVHRLVQ